MQACSAEASTVLPQFRDSSVLIPLCRSELVVPSKRFLMLTAWLLAVLTVLLPSRGVAVAADGGSPVTTSSVAVTKTAGPASVPWCLDPLFALSNSVASTSEYFRLTVHVSAQLCSPLQAKAVIYAMPGGGVAWPQELVTVLPFTIDGPGTVEVTFTKGCGAAQFDVVTGATPQTISPWGEWHGPLLFPFDTGTAQQWWASPCETTTTTTTSTPATTTTTTPAVEETTTTTTTTAPATTTTLQAPVEGPTTTTSTTTAVAPASTTTVPAVVVPPTTSTTVAPPEVLADGQRRVEVRAHGAEHSQLAVTGVNVALEVLIAAVLLVTGFAVLGAWRTDS